MFDVIIGGGRRCGAPLPAAAKINSGECSEREEEEEEEEEGGRGAPRLWHRSFGPVQGAEEGGNVL